MTNERWLTIPNRGMVRNETLQAQINATDSDYARVWDACKKPSHLLELAIVSGLPVETVLDATVKSCADAWNNWTGGATDARPPQILNGVTKWLRREAGFEEIWATWELSEQLRREVLKWYKGQQGAVLSTAVLNAVEAIYTLTTVSRNLAEPETNHDQFDAARYQRKNQDPAFSNTLFQTVEAVQAAQTAGSWYHSHTEPSASEDDHSGYAAQILGFLLRNHLPSTEVIQGLRDRLGTEEGVTLIEPEALGAELIETD